MMGFQILYEPGATDLKMTLNDMPGHLIRRLHQISTQVFQKYLQETDYDITSVQYATMLVLKDNPGIEQAQVASLIAHDRATIGGVIDRLEQKGYLIRLVSARDRRAREVSLSEEGLKVVEEVTPVVEALQRNILANLSNAEASRLTAILRKAVGLDPS